MANKLTRRQALKAAGVAALGGLAASGKLTRVAYAQEEPWEAFADEELVIEMGSMFFRVQGGEDNAPITLEVGKTYAIEFVNLDDGIVHNAHFGKDPDVDNAVYNTLLFDGLIGVEMHGGESGEIFVKIPDKPGDWEIGCFVTGHYEAGMKAPLIIK